MSSFRYTPEMVDCHYCTEYEKKHGCRIRDCPWIAERIEAGTVGYLEVLRESHLIKRPIQKRLGKVLDQFPNSFWADSNHATRMTYLKNLNGYSKKRNTSAWYAVIYLLSSNAELCGRTVNCLRVDGVDFRKARTKSIKLSDYALLMAAKTIYTSETKITVADLANQEIVDNKTFRLILNALLIAHYGIAVLDIKEKSIKGDVT